MEPSSQEETFLLQPHHPIFRKAAEALDDEGIPVLEWRHGDPVVLLLVEWAVPDEMLSRSSQILSDRGFFCKRPSTRDTDRYGPWERGGKIHKLHGGFKLLLYPLSFVGISLQNTVEVISTFDRRRKILTPTPRMYMESLIGHLLDHPVGDCIRRVLLSFISFYILREEPLNTKEGEWDDQESEEDFQKRAGDAIIKMKTWDWNASGKNYLSIAESVVRNCQSIAKLSSH
ncbi:hypothetical protein N7499_001953 [Penicillium canescens]|nr:hypothetical protein N7499_001953 [Penicillium canescens]KAJ6165568.1 hypothetical protein N7485_008812 [Penicillium canescens]